MFTQANLWYRGIVLYGSIGLPQAKFTNALTLAPSALGRAPTDQMMELFRGMKVVGHAGDGEEACLLYKQLCPDILILDHADAKEGWH